MSKFAREHGHKEFYIDRPKLLAMMRLVDDDRNGSINKEEFRRFVLACVKKEEKAANAEIAALEWNPSAESLLLANGIHEKLKGQSGAELRALEGVLSGLLQDVVIAAKSAGQKRESIPNVQEIGDSTSSSSSSSIAGPNILDIAIAPKKTGAPRVVPVNE
jgi:hypothetical protein